jgi:hypothetical protein
VVAVAQMAPAVVTAAARRVGTMYADRLRRRSRLQTGVCQAPPGGRLADMESEGGARLGAVFGRPRQLYVLTVTPVAMPWAVCFLTARTEMPSASDTPTKGLLFRY